MFSATSFYGSGKRLFANPPDSSILSFVPQDGVESHDPECSGGEDGDLSSDSDFLAEGT